MNVRIALLLLSLTACATPERPAAPPPERFEGPGERLFLAVALEPGARVVGGHLLLTAPDRPEIAWAPFGPSPGLELELPAAGLFISEPLDETRLAAMWDPAADWKLGLSVTTDGGGLHLPLRVFVARRGEDPSGAARLEVLCELPVGSP